MARPRVKFGLAVNASETVNEAVQKSAEAERRGLDYVWVGDASSERYGPTVASAIAANTKRLRIGLGLLSPYLHSPTQISSGFTTLVELFGERFDLCIGVGDRSQLQRAGVIFPVGFDHLKHLMNAKEAISKRFLRNKIRAKIFLGAQGPKILKIARFFDGVLLNHASPDMVKWAINQIEREKKVDLEIGIYAPSYVYSHFKEEVYKHLRIASSVVALGASTHVLEHYGVCERLRVARWKLRSGSAIDSVLKEVPKEVVGMFSIHMPSERLPEYIGELVQLGVNQIVLGYPQNFSKETVRDLAKALIQYRRSAGLVAK